LTWLTNHTIPYVLRVNLLSYLLVSLAAGFHLLVWIPLDLKELHSRLKHALYIITVPLSICHTHLHLATSDM